MGVAGHEQVPDPGPVTGDLGNSIMTLGCSDKETLLMWAKPLDQERSSLLFNINENMCCHLTSVTSFPLPNMSLVYILLKMGNLRFKEVR